jgi:hypothetical protein
MDKDPIKLKITSSNKENRTVVLFDFINGFPAKNYGNVNGVSIVSETMGISYEDILNSISSKPQRIVKIRAILSHRREQPIKVEFKWKKDPFINMSGNVTSFYLNHESSNNEYIFENHHHILLDNLTIMQFELPKGETRLYFYTE